MSDQLTAADLVGLRVISDPTITSDGGLLGGTVHDPPPERGSQARADIWLSRDGGPAAPVTGGPGTDLLPRISPSRRQLAFTSDRLSPALRRLFLLDLDEDGRAVGEPRLLDGVPGNVEALIWSTDEAHLLVQAADEGSDTGNIGGGLLFAAERGDDGVEVQRPGSEWRRALLVDVGTGEAVQVSPDGQTVWEIGWAGAGPAAILTSTDPTENGWYDARLELLDLATRTTEPIYTPTWQLQAPVLSRDAAKLAFLEAPQSDRALLYGVVSVLDLASGEEERLDVGADVARLGWTADGGLLWSGRSSVFAVCGLSAPDGAGGWTHQEISRELAALGTTYVVSTAGSADRPRIVAPRQAHGEPPELALLDRVDDVLGVAAGDRRQRRPR